jgi:two-component sensor histidine kinase
LIEINDIYLDVNTAIPLGLIVNEIISNSIKHAFPQQQSGEIKIKMFIENGSNILEISDNGIGIPDDFNIENTSTLGMQLINSLKSQINSQLEVFNQGGTYFKIVFDSSTTKEDFYGFKNKNG